MALMVVDFDSGTFGLAAANAYARVLGPTLEKISVLATPAQFEEVEVDGQAVLEMTAPAVYEQRMHVVYDVVVHASEQARTDGLRPIHEERRNRVEYPAAEPNPFLAAYDHLKTRAEFVGAVDC